MSGSILSIIHKRNREAKLLYHDLQVHVLCCCCNSSNAWATIVLFHSYSKCVCFYLFSLGMGGCFQVDDHHIPRSWDYIIEFCQALERQTSYCMHVASHNKNVFHPTPILFSPFDVNVLTNKHLTDFHGQPQASNITCYTGLHKHFHQAQCSGH